MSFTSNTTESKGYQTSVEESHPSSKEHGAFTDVRKDLRLAILDGKDAGKDVSAEQAKLDTLDKLPEFAKDVYNKLQESGNNQNVRYTAKVVKEDNIGKDGKVYAKAGDLQMSMTIQTGKDRKLNVPIEVAEDGSLKAGFITAEDKTKVERTVNTKDGKSFDVYEKIGFKDMTDREKDIVQIVSGKDFSKNNEKTDFSKAYAVKREQLDALKSAGYDAYISKDKSKEDGTYKDTEGNEHPSYKDRIEYGSVDIEGESKEAIAYTLNSPKESNKPLPFSIEVIVTAEGEVAELNKVEFSQKEDGKYDVVKSPVSLADLDPVIANALMKSSDAPTQEAPMQSFGKSDAQVEQPHKSNGNFTR